MLQRFYNWLWLDKISIFPIVTFRIAFGILMLAALIRFAANGWIKDLYISPSYFFSFYGFEWVYPPSSEIAVYAIFVVLLLSIFFVTIGFLYRISSIVFFLLFTYVELWDKANYLNHYYFVSLVSFILCFLPAHRNISFDVWFKIAKPASKVSRVLVLFPQLQMATVYFFAGVAKMNYFWIFEAMPLKLWLPLRYDVPVLGDWLRFPWLAYAFSWIGLLFDTFVPYFLFKKKFVWYAYLVVVIFHVLTAILFPVIGMFPFIMMVCASVFLPSYFHEMLWLKWKTVSPEIRPSNLKIRLISFVFLLFFSIQWCLPFRCWLYPGELFWTEQGFRFSWRVMLIEKAGYCLFVVKDKLGKMEEVRNRFFLTPQQEKMMSTQPDMMLQFAHYIGEHYKNKGFVNPEVYVEAQVALQGRPAQLMVNPSVDLMKVQESFAPKAWLLPWKE